MSSDLTSSFAVVHYIDGPLARFVDSLRRELTPGCPHKAHVTLLPPRDLEIPTHEAIEACSSIAGAFQPFEVDIGDVEVFERTQVIKLAVTRGAAELRTLHDVLNTGVFEREENFIYTPHITLCMEIQATQVDGFLDRAKQKWAEFGGSAHFFLDEVTFVRKRVDERWIDLATIPVGQPVHVRSGR